MWSPQHPSLFTFVMKIHDRQSSERCIRKINRTKKSQNLKSSSELTYRMYKLCKFLLVCTYQNYYDENIWSCQRRKYKINKEKNAKNTIILFITCQAKYIFLFSMEQRPEFLSNFWVARLFILFTPRNQLVVPTINQENNEPKNQQGKKCQKYDYFVHNMSPLFWHQPFHNLVRYFPGLLWADEDFKFWDFLVLFRFPQMGPCVIHYDRFQCFCPVFRINWFSQNEIHCSWGRKSRSSVIKNRKSFHLVRVFSRQWWLILNKTVKTVVKSAPNVNNTFTIR
jgi:hypothetical protein